MPTDWRPTLKRIADAIQVGALNEVGLIKGVRPLNDETINQIRAYIADYGETLVPLPDESWQSSVYICIGQHWEVTVDLFTEAEGRSDLVFTAHVYDVSDNYEFEVRLVYVP